MENQSQPLFTNDPNEQTAQQPTSIDTILTNQRQEWVAVIEEMNESMKTLPKVDELLNTVYSKRQKAVEYYYAMNAVILKHTKEYKALYNAEFNAIKINGYNGMRFTSDQGIARQVETDLQEKKELIDMLSNQNNFIKETIQTIDNIIYGINQKVKIQEIINGLKF